MLIDGHAHLYPLFDRATFLASAACNLAAAARAAGADGREAAALLLTETPRETAFDDLGAGRGVPTGWEATCFSEDPSALHLIGPGGAELMLVAGRQFVTSERLEVLAIGRRAADLDGLPLAETLAQLGAEGHPAILPWGAGKWTGARRRTLEAVLADGLPRGVFLGDNAGRPSVWPTPRPFRGAGIMLPGTDPLPVPSACADVGRYGFRIDLSPDPRTPGRAVTSALMALDAQPQVLGRRLGPAAALDRQIRLRAS